jgi:hypothetical protein
VTVKLILKVIHKTWKKTGLSRRCLKCFKVGAGSKKLLDRNSEMGRINTSNRNKTLGREKHHPNWVGSLGVLKV